MCTAVPAGSRSGFTRCSANTKLGGALLQPPFEVSSETLCRTACTQRADCEGFAYSKSRRCSLQHSIGNERTADESVVQSCAKTRFNREQGACAFVRACMCVFVWGGGGNGGRCLVWWVHDAHHHITGRGEWLASQSEAWDAQTACPARAICTNHL